MNRYKQREQAFLLMFENSFHQISPAELVESFSENIEKVGEYAEKIFIGATNNIDELDEIISKYSTGWKLSRIPKVNSSILRLAVYEMKFVDDVPDSVAINEAVELAKKYSGKDDFAFINGILGAFSRSSS